MQKVYRKQKIMFFLFLIIAPSLISILSFESINNHKPNRKICEISPFPRAHSLAWHPVPESVNLGPFGVFVNDANNDGYKDIVVSSDEDKISILTWNSGTNKWNSYIQKSTGGCSLRPVVNDVNNDGYNDIIVPNYYDADVSIYYWNPGANNWHSETKKNVGNKAYSVAVGDANNDGYNDLVVSHYALSNSIYVYPWDSSANTWGSTEYLSSEYNPAYVQVADVNNDGYQDIISSHNDQDGGFSILQWNSGTDEWNSKLLLKTIDEVSIGTISDYIIADADNDGDRDIIASKYGNEIIIIPWNSGNWDTPILKTIGKTTRGVAVADMNNDGKLDIICSNKNDDTIAILTWNSDSSDWNMPKFFPAGDSPGYPKITDFDGDGYKDIALANYDVNTVSILYGYDDINSPILKINNPLPEGNFSSPPMFNVEVSDDYHIDDLWYSYNSNPTKYFFTLNGTLTDWVNLPDGEVTITFYVNDTAGNEYSDVISINKDNTKPIILINSPNEDDAFNNTSPSFNIEFFDIHLDKMWFNFGELNLTNHPIHDNGTLIGWESLPEGEITVVFYANDTFGNEANENIYLNKDLSPPIINIRDPDMYSVYANSSPFYYIEIEEENLDAIWYNINQSQNINIELSEWWSSYSGNINDSVWAGFPSSYLNIFFYANDSFGRLSSNNVTIIKDLDDPFISIDFPSAHQVYGWDPPTFECTILEPNIKETFYSIDGSRNYTFYGYCDNFYWNQLTEGDHTFTIWVVDLVDHATSDEIVLIKDTTPPELTIDSPRPDESFEDPPVFSLSVSDDHLDRIWYSIEEESEKIFCEKTATLDLDLWQSFNQGYITFEFYANDTGGNEVSSTIRLKKVEPEEKITEIIGISESIPITIGLMIGTLICLIAVIKTKETLIN